MKTSTFQEFYTQFLRLAHEAKIPEDQRKDDMISKLSFNLQKLILLMRMTIRTLTDLVSTCQLVDSEARALDLRIGNRKPGTRTDTPTATSRITPITTTTTSGTRNTISSNPRNNPQKDALMKEGKCFKCQKVGHLARNCTETILELSAEPLSENK
jgi:hypothetical protein